MALASDSSNTIPYINTLIFTLVSLFVAVVVVLVIITNEFSDITILLVTVVAGMLGISIFAAASIVNERTTGSGADTSNLLVIAKCPDYYSVTEDGTNCSSEFTLRDGDGKTFDYKLLKSVESAAGNTCELGEVQSTVAIASPGHGKAQKLDLFCEVVNAAVNEKIPWVNARRKCKS